MRLETANIGIFEKRGGQRNFQAKLKSTKGVVGGKEARKSRQR